MAWKTSPVISPRGDGTGGGANGHREGRQVTGIGDYILGTAWVYFRNAGLWEPSLHTYHRMMVVVIRGEGAACNRRYQQGRTQWPIRRITCRPQLEREVTFDVLKD